MADLASVGQADLIVDDVKTAKSKNIPFIMGESNSASCGGMTGISDSIASALWFLDYAMNLASIDVSR